MREILLFFLPAPPFSDLRQFYRFPHSSFDALVKHMFLSFLSYSSLSLKICLKSNTQVTLVSNRVWDLLMESTFPQKLWNTFWIFDFVFKSTLAMSLGDYWELYVYRIHLNGLAGKKLFQELISTHMTTMPLSSQASYCRRQSTIGCKSHECS